MPASSRKPCDAANPRRRAKSCALRCGRGLAATHKRRPSVRPAGGPMKSSAPTQGTAALHDRHPPAMPAPRFRRPFALHCRAGVHARRGGFTAARKGIGKARRRTPQSADADSSPYRGGGCAVRRRRKGALPLCPTDILQSPAGPCPRIRRGRCWHRPGNLAMPQTPNGGRNRPPYIAAGAWRQRINASLSPGPPAGRCKHRRETPCNTAPKRRLPARCSSGPMLCIGPLPVQRSVTAGRA